MQNICTDFYIKNIDKIKKKTYINQLKNND